MQTLVENLVKLQAVELERTRIAQAARLLPAEIAQAEATLTAVQREAAEASAALSREESLRTRLEREIDSHRKKADRFRAQQDAVKNPAEADAIEHELGFAQREIERLESDELASMERTEAQESALAAARARVESHAAALDKTRARVAVRHAELTGELAVLAGEREQLRAAVDPEWLTRFDRLCGSRGTGLARAENQQCIGCRMGVRPQVWNQLREGELLSCDSCGRLLYWDPAFAPAPPAPKEPKPAGRSANRKSQQAGD
jgi:uncharacterized protein